MNEKPKEGMIVDKNGESKGDRLFHERDMLTTEEEGSRDLEAARESLAPTKKIPD